ncbi:Single-stranded DNA-binding protein [[Mycoplasma] cavipharyngis]|uniref:single-stranded DNA-binding protein n=1 Tax=[Mycoplasma] cavipharyngis TaxID=92757 RepID=UPI0037041A27
MLPKVYLIGNLAQDPKFGITNSGIKYARICVACSGLATKNNTQPQSNYFHMTVWRKTADLVEKYLSKGDGVFVEGNLSVRSYTNNEKQVVYITEINVSQLQITNRRSNTNYSNVTIDHNYNNSSINEQNFDSFSVPIDDQQIVNKTKLHFDPDTEDDNNDSAIYDELFSDQNNN